MITKTYTVGRLSSADISIQGNTKISRCHITIGLTTTPGTYLLSNQAPTNGTYIRKNDRWIKLGATDQLELPGSTEIRLGTFSTTINGLLQYAHEKNDEGDSIRYNPSLPPIPEPAVQQQPEQQGALYRNELGEIVRKSASGTFNKPQGIHRNKWGEIIDNRS